jgi:ubiquinone/menaquinone biosynthesis C-methylase UbiE
MYEETADWYADMMDTEINLPVYADVLGRLSNRIANLPGTVIDTACGSGHMLSMYWNRFDQNHTLLGIDLSPSMVAIAEKRLGANAEVIVGDMRDLSTIESDSSSAILNFYALHHLDAAGIKMAFKEWQRVLTQGGQLVVATWEGQGAIDYGDQSDIVALRYRSTELYAWAIEAGFTVSRCVVEPVAEFPMNAVNLEAVRS